MSYFLLFYPVVPDYVARRAEFREEHLALAQAAHARGELVLGGALVDPTDEAVIAFRGNDSSVVERFVAADPYVQNGLVVAWRVRKWAVVVGG